MQVEALEAGDVRLSEVLALYKTHARTLGFMPQGAFEDRAASGTLLVATETDDIHGYVLYDLPSRHVAVRHLCVRQSLRNKGVARLLIDELAQRHPERRGILLSCRNDFPAASLWSRLDFEPLTEVQGRSREGHLLTRWWRDFGHPTLFTVDAETLGSVMTAALDTDVFLDLSSDEVRPSESQHLLDDWVSEQVELFITKEIWIEVQESTRRRGSAFRQRDAQAAVWKPIADGLREILKSRGFGVISDHDECDIRHVARAAAVGASFFLTRDKSLIRRLRDAAKRAGVEVATPGEFIGHLDAAVTYTPLLLEDTTFSLRPAGEFSIDELVARFLSYGSGEKRNRFEAILTASLAARRTTDVDVIADEHDRPVALYAQRKGPDTLEVLLLRVAGPMASTLSRHVVHLQRQRALQLQLAQVSVIDEMMSDPLRPALATEGFRGDESGWLAAPRLGIIQATELDDSPDFGNRIGPGLPDEVRGFDRPSVTPELAADLERNASPLRVVGAGITTYLVPIRSFWAAQLFDSSLSEATLFGRDPVLGISREHVYYSGSLRQLHTPARLLWYVSGNPGQHNGAQMVRAVSTLDEAVIGRPGTLFRRYQQLGVWKLKEVTAAARKDKVLAIRFSDTQLFEHPVPLSVLRTLSDEVGHTLFLRSLTEIPEPMFASVYERGINGPD
jgi:predicted nucleic acid-binding protein/GNAT superfamily N-acetyltransferase